MTIQSRPAKGDIRPITIDELDRLGINGENELFWDNRPIEIRHRWTRFEKTLAAVVSVCVILGGLGALASGIKDGAEFLCARQVTLLCPNAVAGNDAQVSVRSAPTPPVER